MVIPEPLTRTPSLVHLAEPPRLIQTVGRLFYLNHRRVAESLYSELERPLTYGAFGDLKPCEQSGRFLVADTHLLLSRR